MIDPATKFVVIPVAMSRYREVAQDGARTRWPDLEFVEKDLDRFEAMFGDGGYRKAGFTLLPRITGTAGQITDKLTEIAEQIATLPPGVTVLLIWSGHGDAPNGGDLRLATFETSQPLNAGDGFSPAELLNKLGGSGAMAVGLIFDVCQAAAAGGAVGGAAAKLVRQPLPDGKFPGLAALYAAHAFEQAEDGLFAAVMERVLRDGPSLEARARIAEEGVGGFNPFNQYIYLSELTDVLRVEFQLLREHDPMVRQIPVGQLDGQQFKAFLNPTFKAGTGSVNVEVARRRWLREQDVTEHFLPKARGLEPGEEGWFFTGRTDVSRQIVDWLDQRGEVGAQNLYVLTGNGGTGKSSVIGRMVALSDQQFRGEAVRSGWDEAADAKQGTLPSAERIDAALHLRKLTAENAAAELSDLLGIAQPKPGEDLDSFVRNLPARLPGAVHSPTIVLDALDEAGDPLRVAERLIKPLAAKDWRILVGTRPSRDDTNLLERLGPAFRRNLDIEPTTKEDIEQYVTQRLQAAKVLESALIAHRVAEKASDNFLYARVTTSGLINRSTLDLEHLDLELGNNVGEAFARDLAPLDTKFRVEFRRNDDGATNILEALAWGEGEGLPLRDGIWATIATGLSQPDAPYSDKHVQWVLREAGRYILESGDGEQAVYRLFHQSLVDHFRISAEAVIAEYHLAHAMAAKFADETWDLANPYLVRHLPVHMLTQVTALEALCTNPRFLRRGLALLGADRLADLLAQVDRGSRTPAIEAVAKSVRRARVAISHDPDQFAAQLQARLASEENPALKRLVDALPAAAPRNWLRAHKATLGWRTHLECTQTFGAKIRALAFGSIDGNAVIAVGAGTEIHFWDPRRGIPTWTIGNDGLRVTALGLGTLDGRNVVAVAAAYDDRLVLRDARTGAIIGEPMPANGVLEVALGKVEGRNVIAVRRDAGVTVRSTDEGETALERHYDAVAVGQAVGAIVTIERIGPNLSRGINRDTGQPLEPVLDAPSPTRLIAVGEYLDQPVVCIANYEGRIEVKESRSGFSIGSVKTFDFPIRTLVVGEVDGELIVAAGNDTDAEAGYVRIRQPLAIDEDVENPGVGASGMRILGLGLIGSQVVLLADYDRTVDPFTLKNVASGSDAQEIRVLSGESSVPPTRVEAPPSDSRSIRLSRDQPMQWPVRAEAWTRIGGRLLQARGSYLGAVWVFDYRRKQFVYGPFANVKPVSTIWTRSKTAAAVEFVRGVALGTWAGRGVLAVAYSRMATVFDLETSERLGSPDTPTSDIVAVALGEIAGRPILATGSGGGAVTVWEGPSMKKLAGIRLDTGATGIWLGGAFLVVRTADHRFHVFDVILG